MSNDNIISFTGKRQDDAQDDEDSRAVVLEAVDAVRKHVEENGVRSIAISHVNLDGTYGNTVAVRPGQECHLHTALSVMQADIVDMIRDCGE